MKKLIFIFLISLNFLVGCKYLGFHECSALSGWCKNRPMSLESAWNSKEMREMLNCLEVKGKQCDTHKYHQYVMKEISIFKKCNIKEGIYIKDAINPKYQEELECLFHNDLCSDDPIFNGKYTCKKKP